jgi:hypothetical protein
MGNQFRGLDGWRLTDGGCPWWPNSAEGKTFDDMDEWSPATTRGS